MLRPLPPSDPPGAGDSCCRCMPTPPRLRPQGTAEAVLNPRLLVGGCYGLGAGLLDRTFPALIGHGLSQAPGAGALVVSRRGAGATPGAALGPGRATPSDFVQQMAQAVGAERLAVLGQNASYPLFAPDAGLGERVRRWGELHERWGLAGAEAGLGGRRGMPSGFRRAALDVVTALAATWDVAGAFGEYGSCTPARLLRVGADGGRLLQHFQALAAVAPEGVVPEGGTAAETVQRLQAQMPLLNGAQLQGLGDAVRALLAPWAVDGPAALVDPAQRAVTWTDVLGGTVVLLDGSRREASGERASPAVAAERARSERARAVIANLLVADAAAWLAAQGPAAATTTEAEPVAAVRAFVLVPAAILSPGPDAHTLIRQGSTHGLSVWSGRESVTPDGTGLATGETRVSEEQLALDTELPAVLRTAWYAAAGHPAEAQRISLASGRAVSPSDLLGLQDAEVVVLRHDGTRLRSPARVRVESMLQSADPSGSGFRVVSGGPGGAVGRSGVLARSA